MNMRHSTLSMETPPPLALDVRLMNITSMLLISGLIAASIAVVLWWMLLMPKRRMVMAPCQRRRRGLVARRLAAAWARAWWPRAPLVGMGRGRRGPAGCPPLRGWAAWCSPLPAGAGASVIVAWAYGPVMVVGLLRPGPRILVGGRL